MTKPCEGTESWHGTPNGYSNHGCRGDACREAKVAYNRQQKGSPKKATAWVSTRNAGPYLNPIYTPDTLTRAEFMAARGY